MKAQWKMRFALTMMVAFFDQASAQQQSVTVTPSERYRSSAFGQGSFGAGHRILWQTPIRVPVLQITRYAGGLEPTKAGGGKQTHTLHLQGADGRQYVFRSVDKNPGKAISPDLIAFGVGEFIQGTTVWFHPTGALIAPPLLRAVSVLHATPRLYFMPPEAPLGEYQETFAGMLGLLEERPEEGKGDSPGFAGSRSIVNTEKLQETVREDARNRIDETDWLKSRLVDFVIGDTDRGPNQWRWARFNDGDGFRWRPIPRDRDFALMNADGFSFRVAGLVIKRLVRFEEHMPSLSNLTFSSIILDRAFLQSMDGAAWAAVTSDVEHKLNDSVIDHAVRAMPREHYAVSGAHITANLLGRRSQLPRIARRFYEKLATDVDVEGSDQSELAEIRRHADGAVDVTLYRGEPDQVASTTNGYDVVRPRRAFFTRRFLPAETDEVRVYLHGGNDRAVVFGPNTQAGIKVRIIGGDGSDDLFDSSTDGDGGKRTWFYDDEANNRLTAGPHTAIDHRSFVPPKPVRAGLTGDKTNFRDWGADEGFGPALDFRANTGFIVGVQYRERDYGFRRVPFEAEWRAQLMYAPQTSDFGASLAAEHYFENSHWSLEGRIRASQYDNLRFFGYGNDTRDIDSDSSRVEWTVGQAAGGFRYEEKDDTEFALGVSMHVSDTPLEDGSPLAAVQPLGIDKWTQIGIWSEIEKTVGGHARFAIEAAGYPAAASLDEPYAKARGSAIVYVGRSPTLALRGIAEKIWGDAPYHDAAFIGGRKLLRGYSSYRFAGDASLVGNAELRIPFAHDRLGLLLLADAGRVYLDGESPGGWHTSYGGGLWLSANGHRISATYAHGEDNKFYVTLGQTF